MAGTVQGDAARLSVVVPAFNEADRLAERAARLEVAAITGALCPCTTELIVVDDGSTDATARRAEELLAATFPRLRVLRLHDNVGKGAAIRCGMTAATAPVALFMDADMSVDPTEIPHLVRAVKSSDVAIGSRSLAESVVVTNGPRRRVMGWTFNVLVGALTQIPFRDTQCGFKAFRTPMARLLFHLMQVQRFAFDVELLCLARQLQMDVSEVAVHWREAGESTVRLLTDPLFMLRDVVDLRRRRDWPPVPALALKAAPGERRRSSSRIVGSVQAALGPLYPLAVTRLDEVTVLLPLCSAQQVYDVAASLRGLDHRLTVERHAISFERLTELAPFSWLDDDDDSPVVASRLLRGDLETRAPREGWESRRAERGWNRQTA
ncbi:MAG TPA: dolichyl-phosphate beta-glucosyltransferase [Acidimicrobiales bacterium]